MIAPIEEIFCEIDDFCKAFYPEFERNLLPEGRCVRQRSGAMCASEIITILVLFHLSHYRDFKNFYLTEVARSRRSDFPNLLSYHRFVEIEGRHLAALCVFLTQKTGDQTGFYYIDSTPLAVCHNKRIHKHKTFADIARRGHTSMGWFYGFKLHVVINNKGQIMAFCLTPGNLHDIAPAADLLAGLSGMAAGDKGYLSKELAAEMQSNGLKMLTKVRRNMKQPILEPLEKLWLSKRGLVETVIEQFKQVCQIQHTRHRSVVNFMINALAALAAYTLKPTKPSITINALENSRLIPN
jgi:IS5 family transposase